MSEYPQDSNVQKADERTSHLMFHYPYTLTIVNGYDLSAIVDVCEKQTYADLLIIRPRPHNKLVFSVLETSSQEIARQSQIPVRAIV